MRVDQVRQSKVDEAVRAAKRDCRLGTRRSEGHESLALTAGEDDGEYFRRRHRSSIKPKCRGCRETRRAKRTTVVVMRVDLMTREYPPHVYGGAGVHVAELAAVLRERIDIEVRAYDGPRDQPGVTDYEALGGGVGDPSLDVLAHNLPMAKDCEGADLVHSHTWYANMAGHLAAQLHDVPHVLSAHSLEPMRPWKAEQLGGGYRVSSWIERTAYEYADAVVAVSGGMRNDILRSYPQIDPDKVQVIHNGIDVDAWAAPAGDEQRQAADAVVARYG